LILANNNRKTIRLAIDSCFDNRFAALNEFVLGKNGKISADLSQFVSSAVTMEPQLDLG